MYYFFSISGNVITEVQKDTSVPAAEFIRLENSFDNIDFYYKRTSGQITDVLCDANDLSSAVLIVEKVLSVLK